MDSLLLANEVAGRKWFTSACHSVNKGLSVKGGGVSVKSLFRESGLFEGWISVKEDLYEKVYLCEGGLY